MTASKRIWDAAVEKAYGGKRKIAWMEIYAGEKAADLYDGNYMPEETFDALREFKVGIKGPLTTTVGGGFRSLNVTLRQVLDLYAAHATWIPSRGLYLNPANELNMSVWSPVITPLASCSEICSPVWHDSITGRAIVSSALWAVEVLVNSYSVAETLDLSCRRRVVPAPSPTVMEKR
jgi:hypothetical protein